MIELRADGSKKGAPKVGRIYVMCNDGVLNFQSFTCERESDWPAYIEGYKQFRRFVTEFIPVGDIPAAVADLKIKGFTAEEQDLEKVAHLKGLFLAARDAAEKAAHAYFAACPVGPERIWASEVFENIRNATRI